MSAFDPKELKTLSDILALVLEDQPGQSAAALDALRARARRNNQTGGALKNLFVAVAQNPPAAAAQAQAAPKPRARRAAGSTELQAARTRIAQLAADVNKLDIELRGSMGKIDALRNELHLTRQARAEAQQQLMQAEMHQQPRRWLLVMCLICGLLLGIASTTVVFSLDGAPAPSDNSRYLQ